MIVLRATHSHLYPGARGRLDGPMPPGSAPCLVEFADGSAAHGTLMPEADGTVLATDPYTTACGTRIPAKRWLIEPTGEGFRVVRRA